MRVLKVIHTRGHGGAENTFRWLAWGLRRQGIEVTAAVPAAGDSRKENWIVPALEELAVPFLTFDKEGSPRQLLGNLSALMGRVRPDVVHSHLLDSNFYCALACSLRGIPHVATEHGDVSFPQRLGSRLKYRVISACSRSIVCVSGAVMEKAASLIPDRHKLRTVHNGIRFLEPKASTLRTEFGLPPDAVVIGNVGNLYPVKGQRFLLAGFGVLQRSRPGLYLVLVGRGGEEATLRQQMRELEIPAGRVIFTGFRSDVENLMNGFDLYVQPSLSEGHPVAVLEAMSLGIPVIATAVGGVPELLGSGRYGTLVGPASEEEIAAAILAFLEDREEITGKAAEAKARVRAEFSVDRMAGNYIECYREAVQGTSRPRG
jgi:glycosyltransferase involved in cell wall biosynthesis